MKILGVDTTGSRMSVALSEDNNVILEVFGDETKKHLETLMPCIDGLLNKASVRASDIDLYALSAGPGSFTGIRIGAAAVQAMAQRYDRKIVQVDTLEALCLNVETDSYVCAMIDARHDEVFACVRKDGETVMGSKAVGVCELLGSLSGRRVVFVGDGASVYRESILGSPDEFSVAESGLLLQRGGSVCRAGYDMYVEDRTCTCFDVSPRYMKLSQAERNRRIGK